MGSKQIYGFKEHRFAEPFAEALLNNAAFRRYVLSRTELADVGNTTVLLDEIIARRSKKIRFWWKNAYTNTCRCFGCSGSEVDVFAVMSNDQGRRLALHVEVKNPDDLFDPKKAQGERYPIRAACWAKAAPPTVPPHDEFCTVLLCSVEKLDAFAKEAQHFDAVITFEELSRDFPEATPLSIAPAAPPSSFRLGMRVVHENFGHGTIAAIEGNKLEINFEHAGRKKVLDSFVSAS